MVFAEIESQLRTEGGWNMHIAIALIMALLVTAFCAKMRETAGK